MIVGLIWVLAPATAVAATRYAGPSGTGSEPCSNASDPCSLATAAQGSGASPTSDIVVEPGSYTFSSTLQPPAGSTLEGAPGQPLPVITFNGSGSVGFEALGITARRLHLVAPPPVEFDVIAGQSGSSGPTALIEQLDIEEQSTGNALQLDGATVRDSVITGDGIGVLLDRGTNFLLGSTVSVDGSSGAIEAGGLGSGTLSVKNVIARAGSGGHDVVGQTGKPISLSYSDFRPSTVVDPGGGAIDTSGDHNISADPLFADPTARDFRQRSGSPTIDAGAPDPALGGTSFYDSPRVNGPAPDIGADEAVLPDAVTGPATGVGQHSATLNGSVDAHGETATAYFEWGTTAAYGQQTAPVTGTGAFPVATGLDGLASGTTFHFRLVANLPSGTRYGADQTFTTASPVSPSPGPSSLRAVLSRLRVSPAAFPRGRSGRVTYRLNVAALVSFRVQAARSGLMSAGQCRLPRKGRLGHGRRCTVWVAVRGGFSRRRPPGADSFAFGARIGRRLLSPGTYRLVGVARAKSGRTSAPAYARFRVLPRRRR
jgi:hypothetical protein